MPVRYRVQIHADGKLFKTYRTDGAIAINASQRPMIDAARALLARGAQPDAVLSGSFEGAAISPMTLGRLVAPYRAPFTNHRDPQRNVD
jgi:hypothetical protein